MKKILFVIVLLFPIYITIFAQHIQIDWQNCFNGPKADYAYGICSTGDGYFITGNYEQTTDVPPGYGQGDVWLIKTDLFGNHLWDKKFGGTESDGASSVFPSGDGNFYIVGGAVSSDGDISDDPYFDSLDYWIIKVDSDGNIIWDKIVGGNCGDEAWAGVPTSDGGLVAVGTTCSDDGDLSQYFGFYDLWAVKLNSSGQKQWDFTLGTLGHEGGIAMIETSDRGFLIGGTSMSEGEGNYSCVPHSSGSEALVAKLDSNGVLLWDKCYGGSDYDYAFSVMEIEEGYMIAGISLSNDGDVLDSGWHGMEDIWLFKIDFDGNILWQKCYGGSGSEIPQKIFRTEDGGYMVVGYTSSHDGDVVGNISYPGFNDIWMFKIDVSGTLLWQSCLGSEGNETMQSTAIQMSNVNYVIAANIDPVINGDVACPPPLEFNPGIWFFEITDTTTVSVPESKKILELKVFPNPATNWLSVEIPAFINDKQSLLQIVDINGNTLLEQIPVSITTYFDIRHLPAGLYVLKFMNDEAFVTKRFVIR